MNASSIARRQGAFAALRRLARERSATEEEDCEFCSAALPSGHRHLLEVAARRIICVCDPCALRFENVIGRWKLIPRDARRLGGFQITDAQWDALALPINLAFLLQSSPAGRVLALYPSPAGATESLLPLPSWQTLVAQNPVLLRMEPDVEALLVNRLQTTREYYIAPVDVCYRLAGLIRVHWRGLSGGSEVWQQVEGFFAGLSVQTAVLAPESPEATHA